MSGADPASCSMDTRDSFPGSKLGWGGEDDHARVMVVNVWSYASTPSYTFIACTGTSLPSNVLSIGQLACPPVVDGGDSFKIWRVALNISNKNVRSSEQGWSCGLWAGQNRD